MDRRSDEQLLAMVVSGHEDFQSARDALTTLVERHQSALTEYLDRLVGADWSLAQDLCQETFLRVLRQHRQRGQRPFKPWLYAIATNLARDHFKSAAVRHTAPLDRSSHLELRDRSSGPEEQALTAERDARIIAAIRQLSPEYRAALLLRFYSGMSLQEIAGALDIPLGTVKSRLSVGLHRLRALLCSDDLLEGAATWIP
jgi:RNA polymerase sigma-70 factor (ECF subfamily)